MRDAGLLLVGIGMTLMGAGVLTYAIAGLIATVRKP
jgi:hypothetical protein